MSVRSNSTGAPSPLPGPDTQAFLNELASAGDMTFESLSVTEKRAALEAMLLDAESSAPDVSCKQFGLQSRDGRTINGYAHHPDPNSTLPILFVIQGGGWSFASAKSYAPLAALLAKQLGRLVITVDFRLAPENPFPSGLEDCIDTYVWLTENGASLGGDPEKVALIGDSAGGNLAAALSLDTTDKGIQKPEALILAYPMIDVREGSEQIYPSRALFGQGDYFLTEASIQWAANSYLPDRSYRENALVSLIEHENLSALPKTIIITAGFDPLRDEGYAFAKRLENVGVQVSYKNFENTIHGFLSFFHRINTTQSALEFLQRALQ